MDEWDPEKPELRALVGWGIIKLRIVDDNQWDIQKGYTLHVVARKDGMIYALPEFTE